MGRIIGSAVTGGLQALVLIALFLPFDAPVRGGVVAVGLLVVYAMLMSMVIGGFAATLAFRAAIAGGHRQPLPPGGGRAVRVLGVLPDVADGRARTERSPATTRSRGCSTASASRSRTGLDWSEAGRSLGTAAALAAFFLCTANLALRGRIKRAT